MSFNFEMKRLDSVHAQVASDELYSVSLASRHAVYENCRAKCFQQLLQGPLTTSEQLLNLGELLFQVLCNTSCWSFYVRHLACLLSTLKCKDLLLYDSLIMFVMNLPQPCNFWCLVNQVSRWRLVLGRNAKFPFADTSCHQRTIPS